jgi:glycosyltransferase involved in cell wall biosynthesis
MSSEIEISMVIPVFNEEENLVPLTEEIESVMKGVGKTFEIVYINDCSTDTSLQVMRELQKSKPFVRIINHSVNSGESAGQATGFSRARGSIIITMDADQQNDPADIPELLANLKDNVVAVCGVRRKRRDTIVKRISSRTANAFRNTITGDKISDAGCTYRALRKSALWQVPPFNGMHRFLPTILRCQGYKVVEILVNDRPRTRGVSKYGINNRVWRGIADCFAMRWYRKRCLTGDRVGEEFTTGSE